MKDLFYDALAIAQQKGNPTWMVTMTCNRNWTEIKSECRRSRTDYNFRYDVMNRSFEMRSDQLLSDIVNGQMFGRVEAEMWVREFQGRGLTHKHYLFIMNAEDRPQSADDVDKFIWAYFPDKDKYPVLYDLVVRFMVHGPCGPESPCWRAKGKCRFAFPFNFSDVTDISGKRPLYRRPNDGRGFWKVVNGVLHFVDNRWVVPFNPLFLLRYVAHINVMFCPSTSAVKYFYGYLLKGNYGSKVNVSIDEYAEHLS